jgi:natural product precursor
MKKINLKGLTNVLSDEELRNIRGGDYGDCPPGSHNVDGECVRNSDGGSIGVTVADDVRKPCYKKNEYDPCAYKGKPGICRYMPFVSGLVCWLG